MEDTLKRTRLRTGLRFSPASSNEGHSNPGKETVNFPRRRGPNKETVALEDAIVRIVDERNPITVRGVCYALFTENMIESMAEKFTAKISRIMTDMREHGRLDWHLIVDGSRAINRAHSWKNPEGLIKAAVSQYRRNNWQDQPSLVEVWSEKSTIEGVLSPVLNEYGVTFRVMKGFSSFTSLRQAAEDSIFIQEGQQGVALYLGDWDPSGLSMSERDIPERLDRYGSRWSFERIAVTQTDTEDLPSFDLNTKAKDPRAPWFRENFGARCYEIDAINPNDLRGRVREQIASRLNLLKWEQSLRIEAAEVESLSSLPEFFGRYLEKVR